MGYGMKYTEGGFPFKEIETGTDRVSPVSPSPALNGELKDLRGKEEEGPRFNGLKIPITPPKKGAIISEKDEDESEWNKNDGEEAMKKGFVEEHVSEGSEKSQQLLVKKNNNNLKF